MSAPRLAIVGVGALGRHHARVAGELSGAEVSGVFDTDAARATAVAREFGLHAHASLEGAVAESDAAVIATPTVAHHAVAMRFLREGKSVLIEKPIAPTLAQADELVSAAEAGGAVLHVGHVEFHNPAVAAVLSAVGAPRFIETHRLAVFTARSLDVDVVLDLMIHDLQITQALVGRPVAEVRAAGVAVLTPTVDIANARIAFEGGCVANLTASRVSADRVRKYRIFAPSLYVSIDMAAQEVGAFRLQVRPDGPPQIVPAAFPVEKEEPLKRELAEFLRACRGEPSRAVSGRQGRDALALALEVRQAIDRHQRDVA